MFEEEKTSLDQFSDVQEIEAISLFLQDNPWEDEYEPDEMPPKWLIDWSKNWEAECLWTMDLGQIFGSGYLIHDRLTDETFFTDLHPEGCCGFEKFDTPTSSLTVDEVCGQTFTYWREIMTDTLLFGDVSIHAPKWLPKSLVRVFMKELMTANSKYSTGGLGLEEWLDREYDTQK
jgi:hypothetical protein